MRLLLAGRYMPGSRIATHLMHAGFLVGDLDKAVQFYSSTAPPPRPYR